MRIGTPEDTLSSGVIRRNESGINAIFRFVPRKISDGMADATPMDTIETLLNKWCKYNNFEL